MISSILFIIAGFLMVIQVTQIVVINSAIKSGNKSKMSISFSTGWLAVACAIAGVVLHG